MKDVGRVGRCLGNGRTLVSHLTYIADKTFEDSLGLVSGKEVLERLRDSKLYVALRECDEGDREFIEQKGRDSFGKHYKVYVGVAGTGGGNYFVFPYNLGSWEKLETDLRKEVDCLNSNFSFFIHYEGYISD